MRALLVCFLLLSPLCAGAFTTDQLGKEFDARWLTEQEKRLLQTGLAFAGAYNGLIDGAWGPGSQRALERYTLAQGGGAVVTNGDAVLAALEAYSALAAEGWGRQYNSDLDMSFLVSTKAMIEGGWRRTPSSRCRGRGMASCEGGVVFGTDSGFGVPEP